MRCDDDKGSLSSDKEQGRINTFIILYPKRKQIDWVISGNYKKGVERLSQDHYYTCSNTNKGKSNQNYWNYKKKHGIICDADSIIIRMTPHKH